MPYISYMYVLSCETYAKVLDQRRTKLDAKGVKCLILGYCKGTKVYRLICLETKKIIKNQDVVFFKDKMHLEDCPRGRVDEAPMIKVNISFILDVEDLDTSGNVLEQ